VENTQLAHRLCNRVDASIGAGRSMKRDLARVETSRESALEETVRRTIGRQREIALLLCGEERTTVVTFVEEIYQWDGVVLEPYFNRGHGPTGLRMLRDRRRFANAFPSRSIQFAHGGIPLMGARHAFGAERRAAISIDSRRRTGATVGRSTAARKLRLLEGGSVRDG
jgi:hypothetical protein